MPKGTVLEVVAHYDNTEKNPRNPNHPPKVVKWGEATTDEMCIGFLMVTKQNQDLTRPGEKYELPNIIKESGGVPALSTPARHASRAFGKRQGSPQRSSTTTGLPLPRRRHPGSQPRHLLP